MKDDMPVTEETIAANHRHDREHGDPERYREKRIRCAWNEAAMSKRGPLTDRNITKYEKAGYYTAEFKSARKALMDKKASKRMVRDGNFILMDGRMIYRP